jgi:hypothetical protein
VAEVRDDAIEEGGSGKAEGGKEKAERKRISRPMRGEVTDVE